MAVPRFAIVGHPNKGKSSLVATLASDETVPVESGSGTTTHALEYPMRLDGQVLYELIDTPGFQRARRALAWMRDSSVNAADRPASVERFVAAHADDERFAAEVELLRPILAGAGIIYVVDGAVPYGPEYEPEMEILRWSGRPGLAVINPIGSREHVESWTDALGQFFAVTREVDVMSAPLERRLELLRAFGELDESWRSGIDSAVQVLRSRRTEMNNRSAQIIAELLVQALRLAPSAPLGAGDDAERAKSALQERYRQELRTLEQRAREHVEQTYQHHAMSREEDTLAVIDEDLFAQSSWELFGLSRTALAGMGASGGAAAGLGVDAILGGTSLFLGSALGAIAGATTVWFAADQMVRIDQESLPLGEQVLQVKAGSARNLPFVLLGRALAHHSLVARRSHANREALIVPREAGELSLSDELQRGFAEQFSRATSGTDFADSRVVAMTALVSRALAPDDH
jgi:hypothetical protein